MIQYEGALYRPPSEAYSLIIQATIGCSNNTCTFCSMYKEKQFRIRPIEDVLQDLRIGRELYGYVKRIFMADGDALIMPMENWQRIFETIKELFPECERVTCYATPKSVLLKSKEDLKNLRNQGLEMVYIGLESGSDKVLKQIHKGTTSVQIIEASQKLHEANIDISVTAINGLGGRKLMEEHAIETGRVLSEMKPAYIGLLTLLIEAGTPLYEQHKKGEFQLPDTEEMLKEIRLILENCDCPGSIFRANHASNYLPLKGTLNRDKDYLIKQIDGALCGEKALKPDWLRGL